MAEGVVARSTYLPRGGSGGAAAPVFKVEASDHTVSSTGQIIFDLPDLKSNIMGSDGGYEFKIRGYSYNTSTSTGGSNYTVGAYLRNTTAVIDATNTTAFAPLSTAFLRVWQSTNFSAGGTPSTVAAVHPWNWNGGFYSNSDSNALIVENSYESLYTSTSTGVSFVTTPTRSVGISRVAEIRPTPQSLSSVILTTGGNLRVDPGEDMEAYLVMEPASTAPDFSFSVEWGYVQTRRPITPP